MKVEPHQIKNETLASVSGSASALTQAGSTSLALAFLIVENMTKKSYKTMNTETKFTPAPWAVDLDQSFTLDGDSVQVEAVTDDGKEVRRSICTCLLDTTDWPNSPDAKEDAANARLIAAAPEMFAALEALLDSYITYVFPKTLNLTAADAARAALAKAKGGAK